MTLFWVFVLATSMLLYVGLDGFDLGVGILLGGAQDETQRREMLHAIAPVWDGNETWLVGAGTVLFGAFPLAYAAILSAFYLPLCLMLAGLILRGVAFEYRHRAVRLRWLWDAGFIGGSFVASFVQGMTAGALVQGLPIVHGDYVGTALGFFSPFTLLAGCGLSLGYALLGAGWLILKCEGGTRERAYRVSRFLIASTAVVLMGLFVTALLEHVEILRRWIERPWLLAFPMVAIAATTGLLQALRHRQDHRPLLWTLLIFLAAFGAFVASFWPYMIPFSVTIAAAAAPRESLSFMFWGIGIIVFPLTLGYSALSYTVFRGKLHSADDGYASAVIESTL